MLIDDLGHDGDGHGSGRCGQDVFNLRILQTHATRAIKSSSAWTDILVKHKVWLKWIINQNKNLTTFTHFV